MIETSKKEGNVEIENGKIQNEKKRDRNNK